MSKGLYSYDSWQTEGMVIGQWLWSSALEISKEFTDTVSCYRYRMKMKKMDFPTSFTIPPDTIICSIMPKKENSSGCHFIFFTGISPDKSTLFL